MVGRSNGRSPRRATIEDLQAIVAEIERFWGGRDVVGLHQALYIHELGETALVIDDDSGVLAYLLGFVTPAREGYIHVVAVREDQRGRGLARTLYNEFATLARARGAVALQAITSPSNRASHVFHRALGFSASEVPGYSASGEARTVFRRELD
jgi:ribosomal protein S18 acetylase RimI-like enzyme